MVRMLRSALLLGIAVGLALPLTAQAQAVSDAQNKLLAKRAAEADAYRKLAETIQGLHVRSDTLVRDFVTESDVIRAELDTFIRGTRFGTPRWYDDLSCEIDAEITVATLITHLKELHTRHYHGDRIKGTDFEQIKQEIKKDVIKVTGTGAPRPDVPPLSDELAQGLEAVDMDTLPTPPLPPLWKEIGAQGRLMAKRAAELDAMRKLLERIKGLRITSDTQVRDFVTEWDVVSTQAAGYLKGASQSRPEYYHSDEPIVEVTYSIPVEQVITTIKEIHTRHYQGDRVTGTDIVNVKNLIKGDTFEATGMGVAPPQYIKVVEKEQAISYPDWTTSKITAVGEGTDPEFDSALGKLKAARAAELDAKRRLVEQVHGMRISSDTLVKDFVTEYDEISAQVNTVLAGSMVDKTEFGDGMCRVTVSIPGMEVWRVVHDQMVIVKRQ
ncbi:MAG: hypothetical protein JXB13_19065 [Phycisphaerae bacterium]|nr:hypothetical protein [Phycisphaerae bacterium]